jgi:hypothetical protein
MLSVNHKVESQEDQEQNLLHELGGTPENGVRLVHFEFSVDDSYMLCFTNNRMYVFKDKALITNINGSGNDYLTTTMASADHARQCAGHNLLIH